MDRTRVKNLGLMAWRKVIKCDVLSVFLFLKIFFSFAVFLQNCAFLAYMKKWRMILNKHFSSQKYNVIAMSLHGESLKITLTVPLRLIQKENVYPITSTPVRS